MSQENTPDPDLDAIPGFGYELPGMADPGIMTLETIAAIKSRGCLYYLATLSLVIAATVLLALVLVGVWPLVVLSLSFFLALGSILLVLHEVLDTAQVAATTLVMIFNDSRLAAAAARDAMQDYYGGQDGAHDA